MASQASQQFVPIQEIHDGVIVLKDGGMRAVLLASSINLSLKSADEQTAILYQFQSFLNALDFSVQISIQSRKLDITPYLQVMEDRYKKQSEQLMKIQTREYIEFIKRFTDLNNVMTKHFFIVVPYNNASSSSSQGFLDKILPAGSSSKNQETSRFEEGRSQLEQRIAIVQQGLSRLGIRTKRLDTDVSVEVFYQLFNPGEGESKADFQ
jgi:hypothetical protein